MNKLSLLRRGVCAVLFCMSLFPVLAQSDTIFLRNGQQIVCSIQELFFQRVSYTMTVGEKTIGPDYFDYKDINRIVFSNGRTRYFNVPEREREHMRQVLKRDGQGNIFLDGSGTVTVPEGETSYGFLRKFFTERHGPVNPELIKDSASEGVVAGKARSRTSYRVPGVANAQNLDVFLTFDMEISHKGPEYRFVISKIRLFLTRGAVREITLEKFLLGYRESGLSEEMPKRDYDSMRESVFFHVVAMPERVKRDVERTGFEGFGRQGFSGAGPWGQAPMGPGQQ